MSFPTLAVCPYLSLAEVVQFACWEIGPLEAFQDRWADARFKKQVDRFLERFVDASGERIESPSILCRRDALVDGVLPSMEERGAIQAAITFAFLDENPRRIEGSRNPAWRVITSDNTDAFFWPIDLENEYVTVSTGLMVRTMSGGWRLGDPELIIRPPLDLHYMPGAASVEAACLESVYSMSLGSLKAPRAMPAADKLYAAIGWLAKAWRNTATVGHPERLVFLKTGFEAITGSHRSWESARALRLLFESLPETSARDSEQLVWSPAEQPVHPRIYKVGRQERTTLLTDLESWFMAFGKARNEIVHEGTVPHMTYDGPGAAYGGHFVFTAEYLLRAAIKATLESLGYPDLWRSPLSRATRIGWAKIMRQGV